VIPVISPPGMAACPARVLPVVPRPDRSSPALVPLIVFGQVLPGDDARLLLLRRRSTVL